MGIPKKSYIRIEILNDDQSLPTEFQTADSTIKVLKDFFKKENPDKGEPSINIYDHVEYGDCVEFEMYSDRSQNLDFQVELLREYMDSTGLEFEMNEDTWIQAD